MRPRHESATEVVLLALLSPQVMAGLFFCVNLASAMFPGDSTEEGDLCRHGTSACKPDNHKSKFVYREAYTRVITDTSNRR